MAMRSSVVYRTDNFNSNLNTLRLRFEFIDQPVDNFCELLQYCWHPLLAPVNALQIAGVELTGVFSNFLDYPPLGSAGTGIFYVLYHGTAEAVNKMSDPLRTYTLVSLQERPRAA